MTVQSHENLPLGANYPQVAAKFRPIFQRIAAGALEREKTPLCPMSQFNG